MTFTKFFVTTAILQAGVISANEQNVFNAVAAYIIVRTVTQFCVTTAFPFAVVIPAVE